MPIPPANRCVCAVMILQDSGAGRGDGVYLGRDLVITAAHVVNSVNPRVLIAGLNLSAVVPFVEPMPNCFAG